MHMETVDWHTASPALLGRLRTAILNLAVTGRLLPDADGHFPADEQNSDSWSHTTVGEATECLDRLRRPITRADRKPGAVPYYGASTIVDYVSDFIFDEPLVLVGEDGAKWGAGEPTAFRIDGKTWVNNHAHVLRPDRSVVTDRYLELSLVAQDLSDFVTGMTVPKLTQARLNSIVLSLPQLAEQQRIIAKVDELMALCDRLEAQQQDAEAAHAQLVQVLLDRLTQARDAEEFQASWERLAGQFEVLFTTEQSIEALEQAICDMATTGMLSSAGPSGAPPQGWRAASLGDVVVSSGAGWSPSCEPRARSGDEWGVLKVSAVTWSVFSPDENKALPSSLEPRPEFEVQEGDFLISRANTAHLVARSVVVESTPPRLMLSDKLVRLRFSSDCDPRFIQLVNSSSNARQYYTNVAGGTSGSMKNVTRPQIFALPILLPPLGEQVRIVRKVAELHSLCGRLRERVKSVNAKHAELAEALIGNAAAS